MVLMKDDGDALSAGVPAGGENDTDRRAEELVGVLNDRSSLGRNSHGCG